jgi:hypothetical protein
LQLLCDKQNLVNTRSRIFRALQIESLSLNRAVRRHGLLSPLYSSGDRAFYQVGGGNASMKVEFATVALTLVLAGVWIGLVEIWL